MSSLEDRSVAELELSTKKKTAQNEQKIVYSRDFLLSFALLDVYRRLPEGCDLSVLSELNEAHDGLLEPWKGSGVLYLCNSSSSGCGILSTIPQSHCHSCTDGKTVGHSIWLNKDRKSSVIHEADIGRYGKPTKPSLNIAKCKAKVVGKIWPDSEETCISLLSKSQNPYRPPNAYKIGNTAFEAKSNAEKTSCIELRDSIHEVATQSQKNKNINIISNDDKQEMEHMSKEVRSSCHASKFQASLEEVNPSTCRCISNEEPTSNSEAALEEKVIYLDSEKLGLSVSMVKYIEKQEPSSKSLTSSNGFSFCSVEKLLPHYLLPMTWGSENEISGELTSLKSECPSIAQKNLHEGSVEKSEVDTADTYLDNPHRGRKLYSDKRGSLTSKPYEFLIPIGYDYFDSVLRENTATQINPIGIDEDHQLDFDDMWSDISAVMRFDQLMEQYQTTDVGIQEDKLISNDYPPVTEGLTATDNDIQLPDEDSLITVEDMLQPNFSQFDSTIDNIKGDLHYSHVSQPVHPCFLYESPILLSTTFLDPRATYQHPGLDRYYCTNMIYQPGRFKAKSKSKGHNRFFQSTESQNSTTPSLPNQHLLRY